MRGELGCVCITSLSIPFHHKGYKTSSWVFLGCAEHAEGDGDSRLVLMWLVVRTAVGEAELWPAHVPGLCPLLLQMWAHAAMAAAASLNRGSGVLGYSEVGRIFSLSWFLYDKA